MTVTLQRSGAIFYGPPRTGSRWVTQAVPAAGIPCWNAPGHQLPGYARPAATYIRHPVSWLASMYRAPVGLTPALGWHIANPRGEPAEEWVTQVLSQPGCVGRFFRQWLPSGIRVARYESLVPDLIALLREFGEEPDGAAIRGLPAIGAGPPGQPWPDGLAQEVAQAEAGFISEFYGGAGSAVNADDLAWTGS